MHARTPLSTGALSPYRSPEHTHPTPIPSHPITSVRPSVPRSTAAINRVVAGAAVANSSTRSSTSSRNKRLHSPPVRSLSPPGPKPADARPSPPTPALGPPPGGCPCKLDRASKSLSVLGLVAGRRDRRGRNPQQAPVQMVCAVGWWTGFSRSWSWLWGWKAKDDDTQQRAPRREEMMRSRRRRRGGDDAEVDATTATTNSKQDIGASGPNENQNGPNAIDRASPFGLAELRTRPRGAVIRNSGVIGAGDSRCANNANAAGAGHSAGGGARPDQSIHRPKNAGADRHGQAHKRGSAC